MKIILTTSCQIKYKLWILSAVVAITSPKLYAQFPTLGSASSVTITTPVVVGQSVTSAPVRYGQYVTFSNLVKGSTYQIETCNLTTDDVQLYLYGIRPQTGDYGVVSLNDDTCGFQSKILFTSESTQNYRCSPYKYYNDSSSGSTSIKITLLSNSAPLTASVSVNKPCFNLNNSIMGAHAIGGVAPYTYIWSNGARTPFMGRYPSGTYTVTITDALNNSASATGVVEVYRNTVSQTNGMLTANQAGASYTWLDCNNANQPIAGANAQSYTPTVSGCYALRISINGCVDTSSSINMTVTGIREKASANSYQIFPNPANNFIQITSTEQITSLSISDITGKEIHYIQNNTERVDISHLVKGIYFMNLTFKNGGTSTEKFIKQ